MQKSCKMDKTELHDNAPSMQMENECNNDSLHAY